jgi:hypothetical protein
MRVLTLIGNVFLAMALLCFLYWGEASWHYFYNMPCDPHPADGRVFPEGIHGRTVYLTGEEHLKLRLSLIGVGVCLCLGGGLREYAIWREERKVKMDSARPVGNPGG